jgi:hypothetical protein
METDVEIIPKKVSFTSSTSDNRSRTTSFIENLAVDYNTSILFVIPPIINETDENDDDIPLFPNRKIYKNLIILSLAFVFMYTAYGGILVLQSSLNIKDNVGVNSLIVLNSLILVSPSNYL